MTYHSYTCQLSPVNMLEDATRQAMWSLYSASYDATSRDMFEHDLSGKSRALLLYTNDELVGFTTVLVYQTDWQGQTIQVLFSGDTVVAPEHWGQQALSFAWVRHLGGLKRRYPSRRLVWFLLVKGHRTYRYMHVFAKEFHPTGKGVNPELAGLADFLARDMFPDAYNPVTGIVEFTPSRGHLKQGIAEPRADELNRPGVAYFLQRNPSYRQGHELVCVCEVEEGNMKPMTLRLFQQGLND